MINKQETLFQQHILAQHQELFLQAIDTCESSKQTYKRQLQAFFTWLASTNIDSPNQQTILEYREYLQNKKLSVSTINGYLTAVRCFFSWLETQNVYPNIARTVRGQKRKHSAKKIFLSHTQITRLLASIDRTTLNGQRDYALLSLMAHAGLTIIELSRVTKGDLIQCCNTIGLWVQKKGHKNKDIFVSLPELTFAPITHYLAACPKITDVDPLFASLSTKNFGEQLTTRSISRIIKNRFKHSGIVSGHFRTNIVTKVPHYLP